MKTESIANPGAGVKAVGAAANLKPPEEATSRPTANQQHSLEEEGDERGDERGDSKDPAEEERNGRETEEKGEGAGSATESRKRRGPVNGADEPPAQKTRLNTRGCKGGITSPDGGATPPIQAGGHSQVLQEASTEGGKKGKVGKWKLGGEGSRRVGGKNK
jgi:hypothetical protein